MGEVSHLKGLKLANLQSLTLEETACWVHIWLASRMLSAAAVLSGCLAQRDAPISVDTGFSRGSQALVHFLVDP